MKTIIASAAVAVASLGVAGVASAQGINVVSPYVGVEHVTKPVWDDTEDEWVRLGDEDSNFTMLTAGTEVYLPYNLELDAGVAFSNDASDDRFGFAFDNANVTLSYEFANGLELYTTTVWGYKDDTKFDSIKRESTSVGAKWQF